MSTEQFAKASTERGRVRQTLDKVGYAASFVEVPIDTIGAGAAIISGAILPAVVLGGLAFGAYTRNREHGRSPSEQSWYNPEKLMDRIWSGKKGSNRFNNSSTRMATATGT